MNNTSTNPHADRTYRVVQWAAGRIGQSSMRAIIGHPQLELVGLHVFSEAKEGRDAGELSGVEPIGIKATRKIEDICKMLDEVQKTVHKYGFDLKNWGSGERMYRHMGELYEKK